MGKKENILREILNGNKGENFKIPNESFINLEEIKRIYSKLGGKLGNFPLRIGNFDIKFGRNNYLELDEQLHFNRYRLITFNSKIYSNCKIFLVGSYKKWCDEKEIICLKSGRSGGKWKNKSSEKQFPNSSENGDLNGNGSSRWKQRAFYDFLKDVYVIENNIKMRRISIWETIDGKTVKEILEKELKNYYSSLIDYINKKFSVQNENS